MEKYIMALDQGTTSSRCIVYNRTGDIISSAQREITQIFPKPGLVEHDAQEIYTSQIAVARQALENINATYKNIAAIGITNQRETTIVWDKYTGVPICNAIVWQCRRTSDMCKELKERGLDEKIRDKTGLIIDAYFSATKLAWILNNVEGARERAEKGELLFGTVETWLIWKLTEGHVHITDYSNASRTMFFNIHELCWDKEILDILQIPEGMLPAPRPSSEFYGRTAEEIFGGAIDIAGAAGDQQAALFGQACFEAGQAKNTYGTGCFLLMNTGKKPVQSRKGLLTTIAWGIDGEINYALEGSVFVTGAAVQWLRDQLGILENANQSEELAAAVENTGGVYIVPAFVGLGAPYWESDARGAIFGITRGTDRRHLTRAVLESMAYQTYDLVQVMESDSGIEIKALNVDGGGANNNFLMKFQADVLCKEVQKCSITEVTSLGAAYLAGLACGYWQNKEDVIRNRKIEKTFLPTMDKSRLQKLIAGWKKAVDCTRRFGREDG